MTLEELIALMEEHGLIPDEAKGEQGSWGLTHRYILATVRDHPTFPLTDDQVMAILKPGGSDRDS